MDHQGWVIDVDTASFEQDVLERSAKTPVVIDFWAPWCEPCKTLTPLLERLASEAGGSFVLARVNVDEQPALAQRFRVQSIPMVVGIRNSRVIDGFVGAQAEQGIREFLDRLLPPQVDAHLAAARAAADAGDVEQAISMLRAALRQWPDHAATRILLAGLLVDQGRRADAEAVFAKVSELDADTPEGRSVRARLSINEEAAAETEVLRARLDADGDDMEARVALGRALVAAGRYEEGLGELLEGVRRDSSWGEAAARKAMIETFDLLGPVHPLTTTWRNRLSSVLFA